MISEVMSNSDHSPFPAQGSAERVTVKIARVSCDGGGGALGHPKVFMDMGQDGSVQCKYCDKIFVLDADSAGAHGH